MGIDVLDLGTESEMEKGQVKQKIIEAIQGKAQIDISLCYCVMITSSPKIFHIV